MKAKVLGIQDVNYISKKTGNPVVGTTLHCCLKDANVFGEAVDAIYISDNLGLKTLIDSINVGALIDVEYNNRGHINNVTIIPDTKPANPNEKAQTKQ